MRSYTGRLIGIARELDAQPAGDDVMRELKRLWLAIGPLDAWARDASRAMQRLTVGQVPDSSGTPISATPGGGGGGGSTVAVVTRTPITPQTGSNASVASTSETTLVTYTPAVLTYLSGILGTGSSDLHFRLKLGGTTVAEGRTSTADRTFNWSNGDGAIPVAAATVVTLTVYHEESASQSAFATIFGYTTS